MARKRRKRKETKKKKPPTIRKPKLFCPANMSRYDNPSRNGYKTLWACQFCYICMLNEQTAIAHSNVCKAYSQEVIDKYVRDTNDVGVLENQYLPVIAPPPAPVPPANPLPAIM